MKKYLILIFSLALFFMVSFSCKKEEKQEIKKIGYVGKSKTEIVKEKGKPMEDETNGLTVFDEALAYGKDFLNYEVFFFKNNICFQHNETFSSEKFNTKYEELKKQFGEPVKKGDSFYFAETVKLTMVKKADAEKITGNKLVFDGTGKKDSFTIIWAYDKNF